MKYSCKHAMVYALLLLGPASAAIMGPTDDRRVARYRADESSFASIGQLGCLAKDGRHTATAVLLSTPGLIHRYVLTVGHAFENAKTGEIYRDCKFFIPALAMSFSIKARSMGDVAQGGWDDDWAIGQLVNSNELEQLEGLAMLPVNPYEFIADSILQLQFDSSSRQVLVAEKCAMHRMQLWNLRHGNNIFIHDCDVRAGGSGGPIVVKTDNGFRIIGVYLGTESRYRHYETEARPDYSLFDPEAFVNVARRITPDMPVAIKTLENSAN